MKDTQNEERGGQHKINSFSFKILLNFGNISYISFVQISFVVRADTVITGDLYL